MGASMRTKYTAIGVAQSVHVGTHSFDAGISLQRLEGFKTMQVGVVREL